MDQPSIPWIGYCYFRCRKIGLKEVTKVIRLNDGLGPASGKVTREMGMLGFVW